MHDKTEQIRLTRKYLKMKISEDNYKFRGHKMERNNVYDMLKRVISHGESHSALIIGPRGSGKTTLINTVLKQLDQELDISSDAVMIKLNGLVHHDEKIALKSITTQMQLENAVGDRVFGTFAENLSFLLSCLQSGVDRRCKSMLFILEEFDMFCHSGRTQTLLYNLFDITHSKQAPMCVLGITNRVDVMELLEKRVKSRFSHRHIFIFPNEDTEVEANGAEPKSPLEISMETVVQLLSMPMMNKKSSLSNDKRRSRKSIGNEKMLNTTSEYSLSTEVITKCRLSMEQFSKLKNSFVEEWNAHVKALTDDVNVVNSLEKFCYYTNNEQVFRDVLFQLVSKVSPAKPFIDAADLSAIIDKTVAPEHRVKMLQSLSILELSLVIAMKHGMEIFDGQPLNFEMVLHRYTKFANTNSTAQSVPRPVILKAFEHLQELEIIMPVRSADSIYNAGDTTVNRIQKEYQLYTLAVPVEDIQEAVKSFRALPTEICHWFSNSVV